MGIAEDKLEIMDLMARYANGADGLDPNVFADTFTEDGFASYVLPTREMVFRGREELIGFAESMASNRSKWQSRHCAMCTVYSEFTSEVARGRTYGVVLRNEPGKPIVVSLTGIYHEYIVRTPKGWRFKRRAFVADGLTEPRAPIES